MSRTVYGLVGVLAVALSARVEATVLCAKKDKAGNATGNIAIRQTCKSNEGQLDLVALGLQQPSAVVKDANGVTLGIYTPSAFNSVATVLMKREDTLLLTRITSLGFPDLFYSYYESADCSGPPFVGSSFVPVSSNFSDVLGGIIAGSLFYYVDATSPQTTITVNSRGTIFSYITGPEQCSSPEFFIPPHTCCYSVPPVANPELRAVSVLTVPQFVTPFHIEVQP